MYKKPLTLTNEKEKQNLVQFYKAFLLICKAKSTKFIINVENTTFWYKYECRSKSIQW